MFCVYTVISIELYTALIILILLSRTLPGIQCLSPISARAWYENSIWVCQRNAETRKPTQTGLFIYSWYTVLHMGPHTAISCKCVMYYSSILDLF